MPPSLRLPELDQLEYLRIVSSHHKDWKKDAQEEVDDGRVDEAVGKVGLPVEGDVAQAIHIHHLVVHEMWKGDHYREQDDKEGIKKSSRLGWALEENPAKKATGLHKEGMHDRNVPIDADDGHHHDSAGLQHLLERVEEVDEERWVEVGVDGGGSLWPLLDRLNQRRQLLDQEQEDVGCVEVGEHDEQPVEVRDNPPVLKDVDGDKVAGEAKEGDDVGEDKKGEADDAVGVPHRELHDGAAVAVQGGRVAVVDVLTHLSSSRPSTSLSTWSAIRPNDENKPIRVSSPNKNT